MPYLLKAAFKSLLFSATMEEDNEDDTDDAEASRAVKNPSSGPGRKSANHRCSGVTPRGGETNNETADPPTAACAPAPFIAL